MEGVTEGCLSYGGGVIEGGSVVWRGCDYSKGVCHMERV